MKSRVALIATLIALIVLALLFKSSFADFAEEQNEALKTQIRSYCQVLSNSTREASNDVRAQRISVISDKEMFTGLYDAEGGAVYTSEVGYYDALAEKDMATAVSGRVKVYTHDDNQGKPTVYAIFQYEDGAFLLLSAEERDFSYVVSIYRSQMVLVVCMALCLIFLLFVVISVYHREKCINKVMHALDRFSEGNFDERIEGFSQRDPEAAEYNAIIFRIQDRIFKQKNRNHVLSTVMSQMQNGIIAVDHDLRVIFATPIAKKLLGIIGNPEGLNVNESSKDVKLDEVFTEAMRQDGVYTNEVAARTAVGRSRRPLRLYVSPMQQNDKVVGALAIVEDITELKRLEQVRTDFVANVSHELKTPLTSIRGFVETLEAGAIDNPEMAHKFLRIIMMETERLTRLINDILSISKLESGDDEVATERICLDKMADDICEMLTIHAGEKNVDVKCCRGGAPVYIIGNPDRVEQMLINLTENAIKYNQPGGSVTVQVFSNGKEANVTISDTGIGIAEEHLPRLFERFYRVDKGRSRQMGGTGLGLAIVKHIVRSMNGEIEVHSKLGEGTEFLITLPLAPLDDPEKETIFDDM